MISAPMTETFSIIYLRYNTVPPLKLIVLKHQQYMGGLILYYITNSHEN
jgi:hypothetical protein